MLLVLLLLLLLLLLFLLLLLLLLRLPVSRSTPELLAALLLLLLAALLVLAALLLLVFGFSSASSAQLAYWRGMRGSFEIVFVFVFALICLYMHNVAIISLQITFSFIHPLAPCPSGLRGSTQVTLKISNGASRVGSNPTGATFLMMVSDDTSGLKGYGLMQNPIP